MSSPRLVHRVGTADEQLVMSLHHPLSPLARPYATWRFQLTFSRLTFLPTCSLAKKRSMLGPILSKEGTGP